MVVGSIKRTTETLMRYSISEGTISLTLGPQKRKLETMSFKVEEIRKALRVVRNSPTVSRK